MSATITIEHVATGLTTTLSNYYMTEFSDNISTKYNKVETFGRMDPLVNYQGSTRDISVGLLFTLTDRVEHVRMHRIITKLQKMQYPVYENKANALTIQRPPLVKVTFGNLIRGNGGGALLCAMEGFSFTPKVGFTPEDSPYVRFGAPRGQQNNQGQKTDINQVGTADEIFFKEYSFAFKFTVLHEEPMGFAIDSSMRDRETDLGKDSSYNDKNMRFIGGYYFGSDVEELEAVGVQPTAAPAPANNTANLHTNAAEAEAIPDGVPNLGIIARPVPTE